MGQSRNGFVDGGPKSHGGPLWCTVFRALAVAANVALVDTRSTPPDASLDVEVMLPYNADVTRR